MFIEVLTETLQVPFFPRTAIFTVAEFDAKGFEHPFEIEMETDVFFPVVTDHQRLVVIAKDFGRATVANQTHIDVHLHGGCDIPKQTMTNLLCDHG